MSPSALFRFHSVALVAILSLALGCGGKGAGVHVSGRVTLDDKPLDTGTITFTRVESDKSQAGGPIVKGQFSVDNVAPGQNKILINGSTKGSTGGASSTPNNQMEHLKQANQMAGIGKMHHQKAIKMAEAMKGDASVVTDKTAGNGQVQQITTDTSQTINISLMSTGK
jgi:hypothetical protein